MGEVELHGARRSQNPLQVRVHSLKVHSARDSELLGRQREVVQSVAVQNLGGGDQGEGKRGMLVDRGRGCEHGRPDETQS